MAWQKGWLTPRREAVLIAVVVFLAIVLSALLNGFYFPARSGLRRTAHCQWTANDGFACHPIIKESATPHRLPASD